MQLSNNLRVSKKGLEERRIAEWDSVYEPEHKLEQKIGGIITMLLLIIIILK